ncbi:MAG: ribbon-helix-helix protein, CopG family [Pseudomonadota bacterium]|jgi:metal-responsive CopG/Arc/MetJ family transcriptional regulator
MTRALVDLPEALLRDLDAMASKAGTSRASLVREAVKQFVAHHGPAAREGAFGLWRDRDEDGLAYQTHLRDEWNER